MAGFDVAELSALEILDSRGRPTLAATVRLGDGTTARAGVPSGASTGSREAVERRDGDPARYAGKGVRGAVAAVNSELADLLRGRSWSGLAEADQAMIALDGTASKSRLGANAIVGVSMALARALAASAGVPLWRWLNPDGVTPCLPVPHFNVLNGGVHAPNELDFQEFMVAPLGAPSVAEAVRAGAEVYAALRLELADRKLSTGLGDEGPPHERKAEERRTSMPDTRSHTSVEVVEATREEGQAMLDRAAREVLNISGTEFLAKWDAGEYEDSADPAITRVAMLIPFAR
ncbi:MAG TPA: hypothetical protein VMV92_01175 [Streptosporangiaceae bacterium]|nr:hypothetical protein [Streptosporangiaceae bacterium]